MVHEFKSGDASVDDYLAAVEHPVRKADSQTLLEIMKRVTGFDPVLWGGKMVGFGRYEYTYDSGHSGSSFMTGFAPAKARMTVYIMPGYQDYGDMLARLGKHKLGKSCLYINKLADVDLAVLEDLIQAGFDHMVKKYGHGDG